MAKKKPTTASEEFIIESEDHVEFDSVALSIIKGEGKKRKVIEIPFNSVSLEAGTAKVITECENLWEARYEFDVQAMKKGITYER